MVYVANEGTRKEDMDAKKWLKIYAETGFITKKPYDVGQYIPHYTVG